MTALGKANKKSFRHKTFKRGWADHYYVKCHSNASVIELSDFQNNSSSDFIAYYKHVIVIWSKLGTRTN